jgi:hypothetical protein
VVREAPPEVQTVAADGWRFALEANVVDDNARGSQLESSLIRSAAALARLCVVRAITPLSLVGQGTEVVHHGQRRGGRSAWVSSSERSAPGLAWADTGPQPGRQPRDPRALSRRRGS